MKKIIIFATLFFFSGCAHSVSDTDVSNLYPNCAKECNTTYARCVSGANLMGDASLVSKVTSECRDHRKECFKKCPLIEPMNQELR
jgi:hypothetical protein